MTEDSYSDQTASGVENASSQKKRMSDADFAAARELYELGRAGISELADDYGVSRQTLSKRFKDVGAVKGSRASEVQEQVKKTVERFADRRADWIEETRMQAHTALKQARMIGQKIVIDKVKNNQAIGDADDDLKALGRFNKILIDNFQAALRILDADNYVDEDNLPVLQLEDLTQDDILKHFIETGVLDESATVDDLNAEVRDA